MFGSNFCGVVSAPTQIETVLEQEIIHSPQPQVIVIEIFWQHGVQINMFTYISCLTPPGSSFIVFKGLESKFLELKCGEHLCGRNQHMSKNMISQGRDLEWLMSTTFFTLLSTHNP